MEVKEQKHVVPLEDWYLSDLKTINNISFTNREIDIIACVIGGRSYKKIASLLFISPKTVENYIGGILSKTNKNSKESIISFVEKSNKFLLVKNHYAKLLIKATFELELKKLQALTKNNVNCLILYHKEPKTKNLFINELEKHLVMAGVNVFCKTLANDISDRFIINIIEVQRVDHVIYVISNEDVEQFALIENIIRGKIFNIMPTFNKNLNPIIFLLLDNNNMSELQNKSANFTCVALTNQSNYFFSIFEILQKLLPNNDINKNIDIFRSQYETLLAHHSTQQLFQKNNSSFNKHYKWYKTKPSFKGGLMFYLLLIWLIVGIFMGVKIVKHHIKSHENKTILINDPTKNTLFKKENPIIQIASLNLPPRNVNFAGRDHVFVYIKKHLNKLKFGVTTQIVSGIGGVGKTQLATEFAYQAMDANEYSAIFWISAETANSIFNAYQEIANYLKLEVNGLELDNVQNLVHAELATIYKKSKILFILDNVPDYDDINNYLAKTHKQLSPFLVSHILITSRSQHWPGIPVILDIFTPEEALIFVRKYLPEENDSAINQLTKTAHFFPLALGQAVAYIKRHTNIDDYLKLYESKQEAYLDKFPGDKNQYNESLWKTWDITINKLSDNAKELLFISAYLNPDNIPVAFFKNLTIEERSSSIEELRKHSLIIMINNNEAFKIHRLLQEVIRLSIKNNATNKNNTALQRNVLKTDSYWLTQAINLLKTEFDYDFLQSTQWKYWSSYLSQIEIISAHAIKVPGETLQQGLKLYIKYALFLTYVQYDMKHAIATWNTIAPIIQKLYKGPAIKLIMASINTHLSYAQNYLGEFQKAKELLHSSVIPIYQQPLPHMQQREREVLDLIRILSFKNNTSDQERRRCDFNFALRTLGTAQYSLGFMQEALIAYHKAFKLFEGVNDLDNISQYYKVDTTWTVTSRGYIYSGQFVEAEIMFKKAKEKIDELYANHPNQAYAYNNIALLMYQIGKFQEATRFLNTCLKTNLANLSPQHIRNAEPLLKLGFVNYMFGNINSAKQNFMQTEAIYKLYFNNDAEVHSIFISLGYWKIHEIMAEYDKAIYYMKKTLKLAKLQYKDKINLGMSFQLTQAEIWPKLTNHTNTIYWQQALKVNNKLFGKNHYQAARCHYMLGQALEHEFKPLAAHKHYKQALTILTAQKIMHPNLKKFYVKNTEAVQIGLRKTINYLE